MQAAAAKWVVDAQAELDAAKADLATQTTADGIATYDKLVAQKTETLQRRPVVA